jgi:TolB-like protein
VAGELRLLLDGTRPTQPATQSLQAWSPAASGDAPVARRSAMSNAEADAEYPSEGVTESLIRKLSQLAHLWVMRARRSTAASAALIRAAGREMGSCRAGGALQGAPGGW